MKQKHSLSQRKISSIFTIIFTISIFATTILSQERYLMNSKERFAFKKATQFFANGKSLFDKKEYEKSLKYFSKCIKQLPIHADAYFYTSQIQYISEKYPEALKSIENAKDYFKKFADIKTNTQLEYFDQLRDEKQKIETDLIDLKAKLANTKPTSTSNKTALESAIDAASNNLSLIQERLKSQIPEVMKTPANYYYVHGNILIKQKKYDESYVQFIKAVETDPGHGEALNNLATLNFMAKRFKEALYFINQAEIKKLKINKKLKEAIEDSLKNNRKTENQ